LIELGFRELHGNRREDGIFCQHGHNCMALFEDFWVCLLDDLSSNIIIC
jgi:hypothetical protein